MRSVKYQLPVSCLDRDLVSLNVSNKLSIQHLRTRDLNVMVYSSYKMMDLYDLVSYPGYLLGAAQTPVEMLCKCYKCRDTLSSHISLSCCPRNSHTFYYRWRIILFLLMLPNLCLRQLLILPLFRLLEPNSLLLLQHVLLHCLA